MSTSGPSTSGPSVAGVRRRPARAEVRRDLLEAAARVFARRGIDAASLEEVAAEAGLTKGAIYSNFTGKADLVETMVTEKLREHLDAGLAAADVEGSVVERARALGDGLSRTWAGERDWELLFVELWLRALRDGGSGATVGAHRRELHASIETAITQETDAAQLPLPPAELSTVLLALSHGLSMEHHLGDAPVPPDLFGRVLALLVRPDPAPGSSADRVTGP